MLFMDKMVMNATIKSKPIGDKRNVKLTKKDLRWVHMKCADRECDWHLHVVRHIGE